MIKAAFFDIDGTLVPIGTHAMPASTVRALDTLRAAGIKVFVSSGRHIEWIDALGGYPFDGYVTCNGALCLLGDGKTEIYRHDIPAGDIDRLVPFLDSNPIPFVFIPAEGGLFFTEITPTARMGIEMLKIPSPRIASPLEALGRPMVQLMAFASTPQMEQAGLFTEILTGCQATSWSELFADITPRGSSKAVGIRKMAEHFGIPIEETAAFGDGENDIPMLKAAGLGIAMGNASEAVKRVADAVTARADADGILTALPLLL